MISAYIPERHIHLLNQLSVYDWLCLCLQVSNQEVISNKMLQV